MTLLEEYIICNTIARFCDLDSLNCILASSSQRTISARGSVQVMRVDELGRLSAALDAQAEALRRRAQNLDDTLIAIANAALRGNAAQQ